MKNIIIGLLRHLLKSQIGTGIKNEVITKTANSGPYGHSKACSSLNAISGASSVYNAQTHSRKKKKNHVVATIIKSLPIASKWSGFIYFCNPYIQTTKAINIATAETPECIAPIIKYGANIVECQPSTATRTAKSHETIECTDTNTGNTIADNNIPASICNFHCLGVPLKPRHKNPYIFLTKGDFTLSLNIAMSGNRHTNTNNVLAIRYVPTALGSQTKGDFMFGHIFLSKS